jgi:hypothetical protein
MASIVDHIRELEKALDNNELRLTIAESLRAVLEDYEGCVGRDQHEEVFAELNTARTERDAAQVEQHRLKRELEQERSIRLHREQQLGAILLITGK